jgi:hypothetical protein
MGAERVLMTTSTLSVVEEEEEEALGFNDVSNDIMKGVRLEHKKNSCATGTLTSATSLILVRL